MERADCSRACSRAGVQGLGQAGPSLVQEPAAGSQLLLPQVLPINQEQPK